MICCLSSSSPASGTMMMILRCSKIPLEKLKIPKFKSAKKKIKVKPQKSNEDTLKVLEKKVEKDVAAATSKEAV
jgi:hypothetical protein